MSFCSYCGTPAGEEQCFCLDCGGSLEQPVEPVVQASTQPALACPSCASLLEAHDSFCQVCGTAASLAQTDPACAVCGASVHPGESFCNACVTPAYQPQSMTYGAGWTAADHHAETFPAYGQPLVEPPSRRSRRPWLVAAVTLAALAAGGGAATTALLLSRDDEPVVADARTVLQDDERAGADERLDEDSPATSPERERPDAPSPTDSSSSSAVPSGFFTERDGPAATMEAHWANIASGDYQSAYDTFVSSYRTGRSDWVADQQRYGARVADVQATTKSEDGDSAQVEVSVLTRDAGRGEGTCNRFSGTVLMVREGDTWQYRPRPPDEDPSYFQRGETGISSSDASCAETFG